VVVVVVLVVAVVLGIGKVRFIFPTLFPFLFVRFQGQDDLIWEAHHM